ncbi:MAG: hypothetical protein ABIE92_12775, partial [bacterium]
FLRSKILKAVVVSGTLAVLLGLSAAFNQIVVQQNNLLNQMGYYSGNREIEMVWANKISRLADIVHAKYFYMDNLSITLWIALIFILVAPFLLVRSPRENVT